MSAGIGAVQLVLLAALVAACGGTQLTPAQAKSRADCYAKASLGYHARSLNCSTDACLDVELVQEQEEQEACP